MQEERDSLFRLACYKTGNADDAADIIQDVFMKIWDMDSVSVRDVKRYLYKRFSLAYHIVIPLPALSYKIKY